MTVRPIRLSVAYRVYGAIDPNGFADDRGTIPDADGGDTESWGRGADAQVDGRRCRRDGFTPCGP